VPTLVKRAIAQGAGEGATQLVAYFRVVVGSVDSPGHGDEDGVAPRDPLFRDLVAAELGLVVPAHESLGQVAPIRLVDDLAAGVAHRVERAHVDDPGDTGGHSGVDRALDGRDVDRPHRLPLIWPDANSVVPGKVHDRVVTGHQGCQALDRAGDVIHDDVGAKGGERPAPVGVTDDGGDRVTASPELPDERPPDEPRAPRHEPGSRRTRRGSDRRRVGGAVSRSACPGRCSPAKP
jgi:hypothetical protein